MADHRPSSRRAALTAPHSPVQQVESSPAAFRWKSGMIASRLAGPPKLAAGPSNKMMMMINRKLIKQRRPNDVSESGSSDSNRKSSFIFHHRTAPSSPRGEDLEQWASRGGTSCGAAAHVQGGSSAVAPRSFIDMRSKTVHYKADHHQLAHGFISDIPAYEQPPAAASTYQLLAHSAGHGPCSSISFQPHEVTNQPYISNHIHAASHGNTSPIIISSAYNTNYNHHKASSSAHDRCAQKLDQITKKSAKARHRKSHSYELSGDSSSSSTGCHHALVRHPTKLEDAEPAAARVMQSSTDNAHLGHLLLKLATAMYLAGEDSVKALECAARAAKLMETYCSTADRHPADADFSADLVKSLHILGSIHCRLGQYEEAVGVLRRATQVIEHSMPGYDRDPDQVVRGKSSGNADDDGSIDIVRCLRSAFLINMQLGDALTMLGQQSGALEAYKEAYCAQTRALGANDPRVADTCRYLAEAHLKALHLEEASHFCKQGLAIHAANGKPGSVDEAMDRHLMALILRECGQYKQALEQLIQAANVALMQDDDEGPGSAAAADDDVLALIDLSIGEMYTSLACYDDEAVCWYKRALGSFASRYGERHPRVALVHVRLAEHYARVGKQRDARACCESARGIYGARLDIRGAAGLQEERGTGLAELAAVYEGMDEREQALVLLRQAHGILGGAPAYRVHVLGIEGQMGVLCYALGRYDEACDALGSAVSKLRGAGERGPSALVGSLLNQMALACLGSNRIEQSVDLLLEAKAIFEEMWGIEHAYTLAVLSNLAGAYDVLGRSEEAIDLLESIVMVKEEQLGTSHPDTEEAKLRLTDLLRERGRERVRKTNTLKELLFNSMCAERYNYT